MPQPGLQGSSRSGTFLILQSHLSALSAPFLYSSFSELFFLPESSRLITLMSYRCFFHTCNTNPSPQFASLTPVHHSPLSISRVWCLLTASVRSSSPHPHRSSHAVLNMCLVPSLSIKCHFVKSRSDRFSIFIMSLLGFLGGSTHWLLSARHCS